MEWNVPADVLQLCREARKILQPFNARPWETLSPTEKASAGLLGRWICDRLLRGYAMVARRVPSGTVSFYKLIEMSGLPMAAEHMLALKVAEEDIDNEDCEDEGLDSAYETMFSIAIGLRENVIQNIVSITSKHSK